jgi:hypothetical protein
VPNITTDKEYAKQDHKENCLIIALGGEQFKDVRRCPHGKIMIVSYAWYAHRNMWRDLSFMDHPIYYYRAARALREKDNA